MMGSTLDEVVEGGAHPGRLSTVRGAGGGGGGSMVFRGSVESGGQREWQQGPAVVGRRGEGEGMAMRWENA
jgi:hypothetical protein